MKTFTNEWWGQMYKQARKLEELAAGALDASRGQMHGAAEEANKWNEVANWIAKRLEESK